MAKAVKPGDPSTAHAPCATVTSIILHPETVEHLSIAPNDPFSGALLAVRIVPSDETKTTLKVFPGGRRQLHGHKHDLAETTISGAARDAVAEETGLIVRAFFPWVIAADPWSDVRQKPMAKSTHDTGSKSLQETEALIAYGLPDDIVIAAAESAEWGSERTDEAKELEWFDLRDLPSEVRQSARSETTAMGYGHDMLGLVFLSWLAELAKNGTTIEEATKAEFGLFPNPDLLRDCDLTRKKFLAGRLFSNLTNL